MHAPTHPPPQRPEPEPGVETEEGVTAGRTAAQDARPTGLPFRRLQAGDTCGPLALPCSVLAFPPQQVQVGVCPQQTASTDLCGHVPPNPQPPERLHISYAREAAGTAKAEKEPEPSGRRAKQQNQVDRPGNGRPGLTQLHTGRKPARRLPLALSFQDLAQKTKTPYTLRLGKQTQTSKVLHGRTMEPRT